MTIVQEDLQALVDAVRQYARAELVERDAQWDRTETSCCTALDELYQQGLMGLRVPESSGGLEVPMRTYGHIIRELAWASPSVAVTVSVHNMVAEILNAFGSAAARSEVLPALAQPGNLAAFAISEPNAGSDPASARTRAVRTGGGYLLNGAKMWVTNGVTGRWFVVLARLETGGQPTDDYGSRALSMFLMNAEQPGLRRNPIHGKMGIRGSETAEMSLEDVFVPEDHLLGQPGWGMRIALSALDGGRIGIGSQALGIAQAALDLMIEYAGQREQFDNPIANFQAIQWMLADSATEIAAAQALLDRAAHLKDTGQPFTQAASMAKLFASEMAARVVDRGVQVHGGYGFVNEFRIERLYRDARITRIYEGTSEIQRIVIARGLLRD